MLIENLKNSLWKQFGAAIGMMENAVSVCPPELWDTDHKFWYRAYHALFYLDYYLDENPDSFNPPAPFNLSEFDEDGAMPERVYTKDELITYLQHCKYKCQKLIASLTEEKLNNRWVNKYRNYSMFEIIIYNLRHVQHHTGQLNYLLRKYKVEFTDWVSRTKIEL